MNQNNSKNPVFFAFTFCLRSIVAFLIISRNCTIIRGVSTFFIIESTNKCSLLQAVGTFSAPNKFPTKLLGTCVTTLSI